MTNDRNEQSEQSFPYVPVRLNRTDFNKALLETVLSGMSKYNMTSNTALAFTRDLANNVFGQKWILSPEDENDDAEDDGYNTTWNRTLPSAVTLANYLRDAAIMVYKQIGSLFLEKSSDQCFTLCTDDTVKNAGHRVFDTKTNILVVKKKGEARKSLSLGFLENKSHTGKDSADQIRKMFEMIACLHEISPDDLIQRIDFFMTDRAGDAKKMLEELEIEPTKWLKCNAHIVLCVDNSVNKVLRTTETVIGVQNLMDLSSSFKPFENGSSILLLGLIALSKLLSPSHAAQSISEYVTYKEFLQSNEINVSNFVGFKSNRFGRQATLAKLFLEHREHLITFFEEVLDESANKLRQAVSVYVHSEWFLISCKVLAFVGDLIIFPALSLMNIDCSDTMMTKAADYDTVRSFYVSKLMELDHEISLRQDTDDGFQKLLRNVMEDVKFSIENQLKEGDVTLDDNPLLSLAPVTNCVAESNFSRFDRQTKTHGGAMKLSTYSARNMIAVNAPFSDTSYVNLSDIEKKSVWTEARSSDKAVELKRLWKEMEEDIKNHKQLQIHAKQQTKLKKNQRIVSLTQECTKHGGPLNLENIGLLETLSQKQTIMEVKLLKATKFPDIRMKYRVRLPNGKFKFENVELHALKTNIKSLILPDATDISNIESLLSEKLN